MEHVDPQGAKSATESSPPSLAKDRMLREDAMEFSCNIEKRFDIRNVDIKENALPTLAKLLNEKLLPRWTKLHTDIALPIRTTALTERLEPKEMKFSTEDSLPMFAVFPLWIERLLPIRTRCLNDTDDPTFKKSKILNCLPKMNWVRKLRLDPIATESSTLNLPPRFCLPQTETPLPNRLNARIEKLLPSAQ
jgi:hypothetical protein